jgi:hypothetical protein
MRSGLIALAVIAILLGGIFMGVASLLILPLVGIVAAIALISWIIARRAQHKPPIH